jgi:hypothetical protein
MDIETRICTRCNRTLPITDFWRQKGGKGGRMSACRDCKIAQSKEGAASGKWQSHTKVGQRAFRLQKLYGISQDQYDDMWLAQDGACALCGENEPSKLAIAGAKTSPDGLVVDHDHQTNHVRGLLCATCNIWLGNFEEFMRRTSLEKIEEYLRPKDTWIEPTPKAPKNTATKVCTGCHIEKPIEEFTISSQEGRYRKAKCKECEAARVRAYYHGNTAYRESVQTRSRAARKS